MDGMKREDLTEIGHYESFRKANERGLVILSMGLAYWMFRSGGRFVLCVESKQAAAVLDQIRLFERQNRFWPPRQRELRGQQANLLAAGIYFLLLLVFYVAQQSSGTSFVSRGAVNPTSIYGAGEWWRTVTALTLHADSAHLAANMAGGIFFGYFVNRSFGASLGWLLILLSGALGNALSAAFFYPSTRISIGASTAVFGALGILAGFGMYTFRSRGAGSARWSRTVPLIGALALLALLGTGDERTDVMAHLCGFLAGLLLGLAVTRFSWLRPKGAAAKWILYAASLFLVGAAWVAATSG